MVYWAQYGRAFVPTSRIRGGKMMRKVKGLICAVLALLALAAGSAQARALEGQPAIRSVTMAGNTAILCYQDSTSDILACAAAYDLETGALLACGSAVLPEEELGLVFLPLEGALLDRYELRSFLLQRETLAPLCEAYTCVKDGSEFWSSGSPSLPKLSQEEIIALLADNPLTLPDRIYEQVPSATAPYAPGTLTDEALQAAAGRLNALRRLAGLPEAALSQELCESAQYGAVLLCATGTLSHTPSMPADMDPDFYRKGYLATTTSNLSWGVGLTEAVDGFMSDLNNASGSLSVGHRRWQLSPYLGKVGFGACGSYVAEKVFDTSGSCSYDFISWPASGNFPSELFQREEFSLRSPMWSVSLNPQKFGNISNASVTLIQANTGRCWVFDASSPSDAFQIQFDNMGIPNCIVFTPGLDSYSGLYEVVISGLTYQGEKTVLQYQVDFFSAEQTPGGNVAYPVDGGNIYFDADTGTVVAADPGVWNAVIPAEIGGVAVTSIGQSAFEDCDRLLSVTLPHGLTEIRAWAFCDCDYLQIVYLPDTLQSIAYRAFFRSWELTEVYYEGTEQQWRRISMGAENDELDFVTFHYNYTDPS